MKKLAITCFMVPLCFNASHSIMIISKCLFIAVIFFPRISDGMIVRYLIKKFLDKYYFNENAYISGINVKLTLILVASFSFF